MACEAGISGWQGVTDLPLHPQSRADGQLCDACHCAVLLEVAGLLQSLLGGVMVAGRPEEMEVFLKGRLFTPRQSFVSG